MASPIPSRVRELLGEPNFCHVVSREADGDPYVVVVWVGVEDDRVTLNTAEGRHWRENIARDPRVTLTVTDRNNQYEYAVLEGRVVRDTHDGADAHIDGLAQKYLNQDTYPFRAPGEVRVRLEVEPEHVRHQAQ
jgi:PPOX class probable F420-dependent enzyme